MFGSGSNRGKHAGTSLIAANCEVVGDVVFADELQINGTVTGNVLAREGAHALLRVSKTGVVKGDIRVPNVIINGRVSGDIHSGKHIELAAHAQITGNVYYRSIEMVMGSRVEGGLTYRGVLQDGGVPQVDAPAERQFDGNLREQGASTREAGV
jgi:cytoskeletal protein CcmA (bactofilin family)